MNEDINRIMKCLTLSVQENEIRNLESLSWAINKLENFSMTFDMLDQSRIGQTLQSVRHSKKISLDISDRIRNLIKCWRRLLNVECVSVIPNQLKVVSSELNGVKNGFIKDRNNLNGINHSNCKKPENNENSLREKKSNIDFGKENNEVGTDVEENVNKDVEPLTDNVVQNEENAEIQPSNHVPIDKELCNEEPKIDSPKAVVVFPAVLQDACEADNKETEPESNEIGESKSQCRPQIGKPKLKSTKELLADFSSLINADTQSKILGDKIAQEDDDPISYHPEEFKLREIIQMRGVLPGATPYRIDLSSSSEEEEEGEEEELGDLELEPVHLKDTKCDELLRQFQALCGPPPAVVVRSIVPWRNIKQGIDVSSPAIRVLGQKKKKPHENEPLSADEPPAKKPPVDIDDLLQAYEVRALRRDMITEALHQNRQSQYVDNTVTLADLSLKLRLKIPPPKLAPLKIRKRKLRRKKKKKKPKKPKVPPPPKVRKPRKPRVKPRPPVTNFLDDMPELPPLTEESLRPLVTLGMSPNTTMTETVRTAGNQIDCSETSLRLLLHGLVEGRNCTRHNDTGELVQMSCMYSVRVGPEFLHVFPWTDLRYAALATGSFPPDCDKSMQAAIDVLPPLFV